MTRNWPGNAGTVLQKIEQLLWNYYENEFLDFIMEEDRNYLGPLYEQKDPPLESSQ